MLGCEPVPLLCTSTLVASLIFLGTVLPNVNGFKGSGIDSGCLRSVQVSLHTSFFVDGGLQCSHLLSLATSVRPGGHPFEPKARSMTLEVSCGSLYGSPSPGPLSDLVSDLTCPFDPLINQIYPPSCLSMPVDASEDK